MTVHGVLRIQAWRGRVLDREIGVGIARHERRTCRRSPCPLRIARLTAIRVSHVANLRRASELIEMRVGIDVRQLHHVLDVTIVTQNRANRPIEPLVVATHEDFVEGDVAATHALDDGFIGQFAAGVAATTACGMGSILSPIRVSPP